jgi:DNA replication initiation complex subunit (GINS family)
MHIFLKRKKKDAYEATLLYYMVRQYGHLIHRQIPYCNTEIFTYALENLTKTHLFAREKTIGNSILHLTREAAKRFTKDILNWNREKLEDFVLISRHRIAQSVKNFAKHYYRAHSQGTRIKTAIEPTGEEEGMNQLITLEKGKKVIDDTVKKLTVYKSLDRKAYEESKRLTKIKRSIADMIMRSVHQLKYEGNIKTILQLFVKDTTKASQICGKDYYLYVRKLMALKRTRSKIYFKQQVHILLKKILEENNFIKEYNSYTSQTQFIINSFLGYYLTMTLRNLIC